jgi:hypothetical protein
MSAASVPNDGLAPQASIAIAAGASFWKNVTLSLRRSLLRRIGHFGGIHPMKLKNVLRRIHPNSANLVHGRESSLA